MTETASQTTSAGHTATAAAAPPDPGAATLDLLEYPLILRRLALFTHLPLAEEEALALGPSADPEVIDRRQRETAEARRFVQGQGSLDLSGVGDVRPLAQRASLNGVLRAEHLREVSLTLRACRVARSQLANRRDLPLVSELARSIPHLKPLEDRLEAAIDQNGLLRENASPALGRLRKEADEAKARLTISLERVMRRMRRGNALQEQLVTERNGRMVLLVKSEMRQQLPGIVHDVSDSGHTAFVEPLAAVPLGNRWREASLAALREEERILRSLSSQVGLQGGEILSALDTLARLDLAIAKGRLSMSMGGAAPEFVESGAGAVAELVDARHPLLQGPAVPVTLSVGGESRVLVITGPNAGGKTVALKTAGLLLTMAQAGLHVPAKRCAMTVFDAVYADIGDQQSIERSLSSFSSHLQNLGEIMRRATDRSLVLLDELGASTDPEEGAALAKAVLSHFAERGVACVATTHHRDVAAYAQEQPAMANASVELDAQTLEPTYRLTTGLPGRSYALTIAARMGIHPKTVETARELLPSDHRRAEELLRQLEAERYRAEQERKSVRKETLRAQAQRRELEERLAEVEDSKARVLEDYRARVEAQADDLWKRLRRAEAALAQPRWDAGLKDRRMDVARVRNEIRASLRQPSKTAEDPRRWVEELKPGDYVQVRDVPTPAEVLAAPRKDGAVELLLGSIKARIPAHRLEKKTPAPAPSLPEGVTAMTLRTVPTKTELDIRGLRVEEAEPRIDDFLDQALMKGLSSILVVHGIGTGALRSVVRERLRDHPLVKSLKPDGPGDGATMVELK